MKPGPAGPAHDGVASLWQLTESERWRFATLVDMERPDRARAAVLALPETSTGTTVPTPAWRFASEWAELLTQSNYLATAELRERLAGPTAALERALRGDPDDPMLTEAVKSIGLTLIAAGLSSPDALGQTVGLIGARLPVLLGLPPRDETLARVGAIQAAVATGFAAALSNGTKAELPVSPERDRWLRPVFGAAPLGIGVATTEGTVIEVNDVMAGLLGLPAIAVVGHDLASLLPVDQQQDVREALTQLRAGQAGQAPVRLERKLVRPGGDIAWIALTLSMTGLDSGNPGNPGTPGAWCVVVAEDITRDTERRHRLERQALHDPLTGLPNRTLFIDRLTALLADRDRRRVGVCFLDLDGFKMVNDSLGHHIGDELLVAVGQRLGEHASAAGHLIARLGGDEFVILLTDTASTADAEQVAGEVLTLLEEPFLVAESRLSVTASIGVVERPTAGTDAADLMRAADITLYRAKAEGRGRWASFDPQGSSQQVARYTLSTAMPAALDRDEFVVEYQPLVSLADGSVRGAEALVRWRHRELGLLSPKRFVGLAEETGAIVPIGRRVLELACAQACQWPIGQFGHAPYVSVNVASGQLRDPRLVEDVAGILERSGLEPTRLQLELPESAVVAGGAGAVTTLRRLAELGVRLALDGFGGSYTHLTHLRDLPIDALKLAGAFIQRLGSTDGSADADVDSQIVASLISLAHTLKLSVVAEGIEGAAQRDRLRELGCDTGQGWFFAPALTPDDLRAYLAAPGGTVRAGSSPR
jgi:diguanylate cyclase (GGDEF)-like protein/PAS domain S-box-containing protein